MNKLTSFEKLVLSAVKKIPKGRVTTYKLLAEKIKHPKAVRAVGNALNKNQELLKIPCHRVVRSDGKISGYKLGVKEKMKILKEEGIEFKNHKIRNSKEILLPNGASKIQK